jgi:HNH endonuclease
MTARPGRCWYCGLALLQVDDPAEHVVPASLGAELTTDRVCAPCNKRAGLEIDQPFLSDWLVRMSRRRWDVRDTRRARGEPPPRPRDELTLRDGTRVKAREDGLEVIPQVDRDDTKALIRAGTDAEVAAMVKKLEERLAREGKTLTRTTEHRDVSHEVAGKFVVDGTLWLRMTTKIAIAAASLVMNEAWLDTVQAARYHYFLWGTNPTFEDGGPAVAFPGQPSEDVQRMTTPPEHLLYFVPGIHSITFQCVLFGSLAMAAFPFEISGNAVDNAWLLDPEMRSVTTLTLDELLQVSARRLELDRRSSRLTPGSGDA